MHIYIHILACLPTYKHIYMHTTCMFVYSHSCMHTFRLMGMCEGSKYICVCIHTYIHMYILMYMESHACHYMHTDSQPCFFTNIHACIHTYGTHTFLHRNLHILKLSISTIFRFAYIQYFQMSIIYILQEIRKYYKYGNWHIFHRQLTFHCLLCNLDFFIFV